MPELCATTLVAWRRTLRAAVLQHATGERRKRHPPLVHVGSPGGTECVVAALSGPDDGASDHTLRIDVLGAMLQRVGPDTPAPGPLVWLTRVGGLELQDVDAAWLASARAAAAEAEVDLTMVVVNRHGWRDPRSGVEAQWKRLRVQ